MGKTAFSFYVGVPSLPTDTQLLFLHAVCPLLYFANNMRGNHMQSGSK